MCYLFSTAVQLIVLKTVNTPVVTERDGEPCGAAEPLEIGNAVAAMNPQRPEHHEHAGEAAVPGEGLLHMWNLPWPEEAQNRGSQMRQPTARETHSETTVGMVLGEARGGEKAERRRGSHRRSTIGALGEPGRSRRTASPCRARRRRPPS